MTNRYAKSYLERSTRLNSTAAEAGVRVRCANAEEIHIGMTAAPPVESEVEERIRPLAALMTRDRAVTPPTLPGCPTASAVATVGDQSYQSSRNPRRYRSNNFTQ